jgi:hypothetical protein
LLQTQKQLENLQNLLSVVVENNDMSFNYTRSQLKTRMNARIQGKQGLLLSIDDTVNSGLRKLYGSVDLRSAKRNAVITNKVFNGIFEYQAPSDLKGYSIIDILPQAYSIRQRYPELYLTTTIEFNRFNRPGSIALEDYNGSRLLKFSTPNFNYNSIVISELDGLSSGLSSGVWTTFGDAENLEADGDDYVMGNGSLKFGINSAGGTTAGIQSSTVTSFDVTDYLEGNSADFVWFKIDDATNITNMILRVGSDSNNYYQKTITSQNDGTAFVNGWNLLRFDLSGYTTVGTPVNTACDYIAIYMTKATTKINETGYKFDWLVMKRGIIDYIKYYTKYPWQSSTGAYKENSTIDTDLVVADTDEFDLCVEACVAEAFREIGVSVIGEERIKSQENYLKEKIAEYEMRNPSEALIMMNTYYNYDYNDNGGYNNNGYNNGYN